MFLPSVAAPSIEVERYQRLRIFRALGSLPAHVTLVTGIGIGSGISGDGDGGLGIGIQEQARPPGIPTSSQHAGLNIFELGYNNGQYTGDFSIASWNTTALFCANPAFREGRMGVVTSLLPGHDALLLLARCYDGLRRRRVFTFGNFSTAIRGGAYFGRHLERTCHQNYPTGSTWGG